MFKKRVWRLAAVCYCLIVALVVSAVPAFATEGSGAASADTVMTALTTGLTSAQGYAFQGINNVLPIALAIAGVILAVTIGYRIFRRISKG